MRIERHSIRLLDADNFAGGCKPLIDQMRGEGLIPDDDPASIEITFAQIHVRHRRDQGTRVSVTEIKGNHLFATEVNLTT